LLKSPAFPLRLEQEPGLELLYKQSRFKAALQGCRFGLKPVKAGCVTRLKDAIDPVSGLYGSEVFEDCVHQQCSLFQA
jgi:hypothetical protein